MMNLNENETMRFLGVLWSFGKTMCLAVTSSTMVFSCDSALSQRWECKGVANMSLPRHPQAFSDSQSRWTGWLLCASWHSCHFYSGSLCFLAMLYSKVGQKGHPTGVTHLLHHFDMHPFCKIIKSSNLSKHLRSLIAGKRHFKKD